MDQAKPSSRSIDVPSHRTVNASMDGRSVASINTVTSVKGAASRRTSRSVVLGTTGRRLVRSSRGLDRGRSAAAPDLELAVHTRHPDGCEKGNTE